MVRRGFTLTELLIVIGIIALLAGLLFPAATMVKRQANLVKCSSNLRQIAIAIGLYQQDKQDTFPGRLKELVDMEVTPKIFLCPFDKTQGTDPFMGRKRPNDIVPNVPNDNGWGDLTRLHTQMQVPTSYCYECSGWRSAMMLPQGDIDWFWRDNPTQAPTAGDVSWADAKRHQQKFGNLKADNVTFGAPFPPDFFPLVRCYHHHDWRTVSNQSADRIKKVNNISLNYSVFASSPYWEIDINPAIPK